MSNENANARLEHVPVFAGCRSVGHVGRHSGNTADHAPPAQYNEPAAYHLTDRDKQPQVASKARRV